MTVGIASYGSYVPYRRLKRAAIAEVLGIPAGKGERAVASFDEDSVSMAVEAARDALRAAPGTTVRTLLFATTTPPYAEKLNAALVGAAAQLPLEIRAADLTGSPRVGLTALLQAADAVGANGGSALVAIADCRLAAPEGKAEQAGGDAGVAFVVGEDPIAEIVASASVTREFLDTWRAPGERFAHTWEERFALTQAYGPLLGAAVKRVLEQAQCAPSSLARIVLDAPNPRAADELARGAKIAPEQLADPLALTVGQTGAAHAPLVLASVLAAAKPGDLILVASAGDGADALLLKVTARAASYTQPRSVGRLIESKGDVAYARYLKWREILPTEPPRRPDPDRPAAPPMLRSETWKFGFVGSRCTACGTPQLPPQRICIRCGTRDRMTPHPFADLPAKVATFTLDRLAYSLNPPTVNVVVDFAGGGRFLGEMTDCAPEKVQIGDEVEMTFRRMHSAGGVHNYFWKCRPRR
ncbi:MAG: OB-fold domain-containing protein [Deltaproteobacteria bacterium]|nr:OB-fold domain-containing protein [Deltaproteobacteria bacterium]